MTICHFNDDRVADLEEQVRYLMEMLAPSDTPYENPDAECALPPVLAGMLHLLMERTLVPMRLLTEVVAVKGRAREEIEASTVRVHVNRLRNYLKPYGIAVGSKQGSGYFLSLKDKEKVRVLFALDV